jgi:prevent-host-death family protein
MITKTIELDEAQTNLKELLSLALAGTEVILTQGSTPLARLVPITSRVGARIAGLHPGAISTSDDFDESLPDEFWTGDA